MSSKFLMSPPHFIVSQRQILAVCLTVGMLSPSSNELLANPPLDIGIIDSGSAELSWPDTGEAVELESSSDLDLWLAFPGSPVLSGGRFRQAISLDQGNSFFRLTESQIDPDAPVFGTLIDTSPVLFPGQTVSFTLSATDPGGMEISYLADPLPLPTGASLNMVTGEFSWTPTEAQTGITSITFLAFNGNESVSLPVTFDIQEPPADGETSLSGILLDTNDSVNGIDRPIVGAAVSLLGTDALVITGADGRFTLPNIPGGLQVLDIATADSQPAPDGSGYAGFREAITIIRGLANDVERPFYLPRLAMDSMATVDPNFSTMVENTTLGVSIVVPPHTAMLNGEEFTGALSISEVPEALAPAPLPDFLGFSQLVTIQPVGVTFNDPVPITFRNIDGMPPGSEIDIWSLDPDAGIFIVVGKGQVTADGEFIETIEGGIIAADWHGTAPPRIDLNAPFAARIAAQEAFIRIGENNGLNGPDCPSASNGAVTAEFGSDVSLSDGAITTSLRPPAYISGGERRALELFYHSLTARPEVIIPVTLGLRAEQISIEGTIGGLSGTPPVFFDTNFPGGSSFTASIAFDARGLPTGVTPYTLRATNYFNGFSAGTDSAGETIVFNQRQSPFGAGWSLLGDQRIMPADAGGTRYLHASGDGSARIFRDALGVDPFTIASLGEETSFATGSAFDSARDSVTETFPGATYRNVSMLGEVNAGELLAITSTTNTGEARIYSPTEQTALTNYVRDGGCAVVLLDHDLGRTSFADANASLLAPFGLSGSNAAAQTVPVDPEAHFLLGDRFGDVSRFDSPFGSFELNTAGTLAETVIPGSRADTARVALLPEGSLGAGSGPVIFIGDTQSFYDTSGIGFTSDPSHAALLLNSIAHCLRSQRVPGQGIEFVGSAGEFSRLIRFADGTFERRLPDGVVYTFSAAGRPVRSVDSRGDVTTFEYDAVGNYSRVTDPYGKVTRFQYTNGKLSQLIDPAGRTTTFQHDAAGDLVQATLPSGATYRYEYDADHLMTAEINPLGGRTERGYDVNGRALSATLPDGTTRSVRSLQGSVADLGGTSGTPADPAPVPDPTASYTDSAGETYTAELDPLGTETRLTDDGGQSRETTRDANGLPTQVTHPSGRSFSSTYDIQGRRTSLTDSATGTTETSTYENTFGNITAINNGRGQTATFTFDAQGRGLSYDTFENRTVSFDYADTTALPTTYTEPGGLQTTLEYDASGNRTVHRQGDRTTRLETDAAGYTSKFTDAESRATDFAHDSHGNRTLTTLPGGEQVQVTYNTLDQPLTITTPSGAEHTFAYNTRGQVTDIVSPLGDTLRMGFDFAGGRRSRVFWGDGTEISFSYADGRIASSTNPDGATTFTYNATTDLLESVSAPGSEELTYTYDDAGRLLDETWSGSVTGTVSRTYDSLGREASIAVNESAPWAKTYDADGLILTHGAFTISREPETGLITGTSLGNCTDTRTYNQYDELLTLESSYDGTRVYRLDITRDKIGRVVSKQETVQGLSTPMAYTYNATGQLIQETRGGLTINYTYDANGNRLTRTEVGGTAETATYNAGDQLLTYAGDTYTHNALGQLATKGSDTLIYDTLGSLTAFTSPGDPALTYEHDAQGRRIAESVDGTVTRRFLYQGNLSLAAELDAANALRSRFGYAISRTVPDFLERDGTLYRIITDDLGSPRLVIDCSTGTIAQIMSHDAYGRILQDTAPGFQPFGYAGGLYDSNSNLVRFGARDYDPQSSQWTASDPIGFLSGSSNNYAYVGGDPVNKFDPSGLNKQVFRARRKVGNVMDINGTSAITLIRGDRTFQLPVGAPVFLGDELITDEVTLAVVRFDIGGIAGIGRGTTVKVVGDRKVETQGDWFTVKRGLFWANVDKQSSQLQIQSAGGVIGIEG